MTVSAPAFHNPVSDYATALQYSDIEGLKHSIDSAYSIVSQRLFDIFFEKFGLMNHLKALKNYMFLGHGDFADSLMIALE